MDGFLYLKKLADGRMAGITAMTYGKYRINLMSPSSMMVFDDGW